MNRFGTKYPHTYKLVCLHPLASVGLTDGDVLLIEVLVLVVHLLP